MLLLLIPKCGGGFQIKLLVYVRSQSLGKSTLPCSPVAEEPEVVILTELFNLLLMICHLSVGIVTARYDDVC
jgi:hypothetical protein